MKLRSTKTILAIALIILATKANAQEETVSSDKFDRSVLPIHEPSYQAITELDARNSKAPKRFDVKAPEKAPNVVIVLT